jgi:dTDP-4-amino-4,6-dideoxygalactose transaminase
VKIPFVDLKAQYQVYKAEIDAAIREVIEATAFVGGKFVRQFEDDYARAFGVKHCISCANGTDAIYIALRMLGIGPGDEVITTASSWISTSETIGQTGAKPVFVDVDEHYNIEPAAIERAITPRTKALLPVHLYGQAARMEAIAEIAKRRGLLLIEDCAQAHLATFAGKKVGTFGVVATFSFYPGKNLGAYGDAGAIITDDDALASKLRMYANHGALVKHEHEIEGINSRLDGIQAAILRAKLPHLAEWTSRRQAVAARYDAKLAAISQVTLPTVARGATHVYHLYVVRVAERDALRTFLQERGIETGIHYPSALPFLGAYRARGHRPEEFPHAFRNQSTILSLPMFAEMTDAMVDHVAESIAAFFARR